MKTTVKFILMFLCLSMLCAPLAPTAFAAEGIREISSEGVAPDRSGGTALLNQQAALVNGQSMTLQAYALADANGNKTNYVAIRDLAAILGAFNVTYDMAERQAVVTTGTPYVRIGGEFSAFGQSCAYSYVDELLKVDAQLVRLSALRITDENGGGHTYYKLRDLGEAIGFSVGWDGELGVATIASAPGESDLAYQGGETAAAAFYYTLDLGRLLITDSHISLVQGDEGGMNTLIAAANDSGFSLELFDLEQCGSFATMSVASGLISAGGRPTRYKADYQDHLQYTASFSAGDAISAADWANLSAIFALANRADGPALGGGVYAEGDADDLCSRLSFSEFTASYVDRGSAADSDVT